jgi:triosephosphate isomerase
MFGDFSSFKIINSVNNFVNKIKSRRNKVIFCVPSTLIGHFSNRLKKSKILIGAQNCHYLNECGPHTGSINSKMIKNAGAKYVILGHSENRTDGDTDNIINNKIKSAIRNNLVIIFCIGESLEQRKQKLTNKILSLQIDKGLKLVKNLKKIIVSYEPIWSIGTGVIPAHKELTETISFIRNKLNKKFKKKHSVKIIYGGSVNAKNIRKLIAIQGISGFLIGGASQSGKKFIDIIKNCYM